MDFINIYKLSNYIKDKTDALLARYGHINKLAETVTPSITTYDLELSINPTITINLNTKAGIIKNINLNSAGYIRINNNELTTESIVFYNLVASGSGELTQLKSYLGMSKTIDGTSMYFTVNPIPPNRITGDIQFWIINPQ
jgi:hypothetical protein